MHICVSTEIDGSLQTSSSLDGRSGVRNGPFVTTGQGSLSIGGSLTVNVNDNSSNISGTNVTILSGEDEVKALKAQRQPRTAK
jgi:hypothetical protein